MQHKSTITQSVPLIITLTHHVTCKNFNKSNIKPKCRPGYAHVTFIASNNDVIGSAFCISTSCQ